MKKLFYPFALLFLASIFFIACGSDDPIEPIDPNPDAIRISIFGVSHLADARHITADASREFIIDINGNIYVNQNNVDQLAAFGDFERRNNVTVDWGRTRSSETYLVVPTEVIVLAYHIHQQQFGAVPLGPGTNNAGWITSAADASKFAAAGVTAIQAYSGENIYISGANQLAVWMPVFQAFVASTRGATLAKITFNEQIAGGIRGLRVQNAHIEDLANMQQYATITNNNFDIVITIDLLSQFNVHGVGAFNAGNKFRVDEFSNRTDEEIEAKLARINLNGQRVRTGSASVVHLDYLIPDYAHIDRAGLRADVLTKIRGWHRHGQSVLVPNNDKSMTHHNHETLSMWTSDTAPTNNAAFRMPAGTEMKITNKVAANATATAADFYGAASLDYLNFATRDNSARKLFASIDLAGPEFRSVLNSDTLRLRYPHHTVHIDALKSHATRITDGTYHMNATGQNRINLAGPMPGQDLFTIVVPRVGNFIILEEIMEMRRQLQAKGLTTTHTGGTLRFSWDTSVDPNILIYRCK